MASTRTTSHSLHDIFGDFNDISLEDSKMEKIRNLKVDRNLTKRAPGHSRFLKRSQAVGEKHLFLKEDAGLASGPSSSPGRPPSTASKLRTSAALRKLAQIESKIMNRKVQMDLSDVESDPKTSDDSLPRGADKIPPSSTAELSSKAAHKTSQKQAWGVPVAEGSAPSGKVSRFLKKREPPVEKLSPEARFEKERNFSIPKEKEPTRKLDSPDSDEEEMKELMGSLMESFREEGTRTDQNFTRTRNGEKEQIELFSDQIPAQPKLLSLPSEELSSPKPLRTSHPPTFHAADRTLRTAHSRARSPQTAIPGDVALSAVSSLPTASTVSRTVSPRTARGRLSSSCIRSEAEPGQEPLSEASDSSLNDFRINVLSLDDLTPAASGNSDPEQTVKGGQREKASRKSSWTWGPPTGSEVSEHLSEPSASSAGPTPEEPTASMGSLAYSEDFEESPRLTASEPTTHSGESRDGTLASWSECSVSLRTDRTPPTLESRRKRAPDVTRVMVKEKAVQTPDPASTCQWTTVAGMVSTGSALGGACVDPAPIASHVVSADAIEALTAYSPAVLALNDMLKQQLSLTQRFLEASRHLHRSLLQSLDRDSFHYHTLEETKEYIRHHRPARLSMRDALKELRKELKELKEL